MTAPVTNPDGAFSGTKAVDAAYRLDEARLDAWLAAHVEGYAGPLTVLQFRGGQSNPTYQLVTPGRRYVLRRKPPGKLLPSAHAVDREFRVISALGQTGFPVARAYALCEDDGVAGSMFYVMSMVEGRIVWNGALPGLTPEARGATYAAMVKTLADLHNTDYAAIGLAGYGKPGNYFARQIDRWSRQYRASETDPLPAMERLMAFLPQSAPPGGETAIVHGDYRLDNLVLHAAEPRVEAVLDWELSTLGDPLADFTYFLMQWAMPAEGRSGLAGLDLQALGIPSLEAVVAQYCARTGRGEGLPDLDWFFSYNIFRMAAICQGIAGRVRDGTASSPQAMAMGAQAGPLSERAWAFAERAGA